MDESSFVNDQVRPVLAETLALDGDDESRDPDRLFAEVRRIAVPFLVGEEELFGDEVVRLLGGCAGLLLAICQPYAPTAPHDQQIDLLIYALRVNLYAKPDWEDNRVGMAIVLLRGELNEIEEELPKARRDPPDEAEWWGRSLMSVCLDAAASLVVLADAVVGMSVQEFRLVVDRIRREDQELEVQYRLSEVLASKREALEQEIASLLDSGPSEELVQRIVCKIEALKREHEALHFAEVEDILISLDLMELELRRAASDATTPSTQ